tara:strand:- start:2038 stop:3555 length:1518 start_codon:yes stop_codon:yes gene_type:complete
MPGRFQGLQALNGLVRTQRASTDVDTPREVITREGLEQAAREEFARRRKTAGFPTAISLDPDFTGAGQMPRKQAEGAMGTITDFLPPFAEAKDVSRAVQDPSLLNLTVAGLAALGPVGRLLKPVGKLFKSTAKNVVVNKAEREAAAKMSESELQQIVVKQEYPIKVHHGTPHTFKPEPGHPLGQFERGREGTGEGSAAYGLGAAYVAENPATGEFYREALSGTRVQIIGDERKWDEVIRSMLPRGWTMSQWTHKGLPFPNNKAHKQFIEGQVGDIIGIATRELEFSGSYEKARKRIINSPERFPKSGEPLQDPGWEPWASREKALEALEQMEKKGIRVKKPGNLYEAALYAKNEDFLLWDKPMSQQSKSNQELWKATGHHMTAIGRTIYRELMAKMGKKEASEYLEKRGIKGIKFADKGSRDTHTIVMDGNKYAARSNRTEDYGKVSESFQTREAAEKWVASQGTSNYVVFNPKDLEILRILGITGAVAGGASQIPQRAQNGPQS